MSLLGYAFSLGESISRQLNIYFSIQSLCVTSLRPRAAAGLREKPQLRSPMKKGSQLIARTNISGFHPPCQGLVTALCPSANQHSNCHLQKEVELIYGLLLKL